MVTPTPTYLALPRAHGDAALVAVWPDGKLAINHAPGVVGWVPLAAPDYAALFPEATCGEDGCTMPRGHGGAWHDDGRACWPTRAD